MSREQIILTAYNNKDLQQLSKKFAGDGGNDLFHEFMAVLCEKSEQELTDRFNSGRFFFWCYRILRNKHYEMCRADNYVPLEYDIEDEEQEDSIEVTHGEFVAIDSTFTNPNKKKAQVMRCLDRMDNGTEQEKIASAVAKIYLKEGSVRAVSKATGINTRAVSWNFKAIADKMSEDKTYTVTVMTADGSIQTGMDYYRLAMPYIGLRENHGCEVKMGSWKDIEDGAKINGDSDLYVVNARPYALNATRKVIDQGGKVVLDIDDYWDVPTWSLYHAVNKDLEYEKKLSEIIHDVQLVTTTTEILADKIYKRFKVESHIVKNCIHPNTHFGKEKTPNNRVRFGWIGGVMHLRDIGLMANGIAHAHMDKEINGQFQMCLGGYNYPNPEYEAIEKLMTNGMKDDEYRQYLDLHTPLMEHYSNDKQYRRLWGMSPILYGRMYSEIDVAMIPLYNGTFNACKSELKAVEAGYTGCAVICSDVQPYNTILNKKNAILINNSKPDWYLAIKRLINNPELREELANNLTETVDREFNYSENVLNLHKTLSKL